MKIKYTLYGKEYEEEVSDLAIYDKNNIQRLYAYQTLEGTDDVGICMLTPHPDGQGPQVIFPVPN